MRFWLVLCVALFLAGCSSHRAPPPNPRLADSITVVANLNEQLRNWRGAPYRYGGMSPRGVDCSGFVLMTFRDTSKRSVAFSCPAAVTPYRAAPQRPSCLLSQ